MKHLVLVFCAAFIMSGDLVNADPRGSTPSTMTDATIESVTVAIPEKITRSMEIPNPQGELSSLTFIYGKQAYMKIFSGIGVVDAINIWNDFIILSHMGIKTVDIFINSPGGQVFAGMSVADEIVRAQKSGFKITAHASGIVASAAVPVYAVCDNRLASPGAVFMVHEAQVFKYGYETSSDVRAQQELFKLIRARYLALLVENTTTPLEDWEAMEDKTTWFSAKTAKEYGLVDGIE